MIHLKKSKSTAVKILALCLALMLAVPINVSAAEADEVMPLASYYLDAYSSYVYVSTSGKVQVWFEVLGTDIMDEIGTLRIVLYESSDGTNWSDVETFLYGSTSGMLFYDDDYIISHVSYQGTYGNYYKAYITIWGGKDGSGDTRYIWAYEP